MNKHQSYLEKFSAVANDSNLILQSVDSRGKLVYVNSTWLKKLGYSKKEAIGMNVWKIIPKNHLTKCKGIFKEVMNSKKFKDIDTEFLTKKGRRIFVKGNISPQVIDGKVIATIGFFQDITGLKKVEDKIKTSETKYRRLFEAAQDSILILNAQTGAIEDSNPFIQKMLGYSANEFLGKKLWEISPFKDIFKNKQKFLELKRKRYVRYKNLPLETKSGKTIYVEFVSNVYGINGDTVIQCNIRDNTKGKIAEDKLIEKKELLRVITKSVSEAIFAKDKNRKYIFVNPAATKLIGLPSKKIIGKTAEEIFSKKDAKIIRELDNLNLKGNNISAIKKLEKVNGNYLHTSQSPVYDDFGKITGITGIVRDVTNEINQQIKLRLAKEKAQNYFDIADVMLIIIDKDGKVMEINKKGVEILGYSEKEIIGKNWFYTFFPKSVRHDVKKVFKKVLNGKEKLVEHYENPVLDKHGKEKIISWHNSLLLDEKNEVVGILSSGEDITKRKHVEGELQNYHLFLEDRVKERTKELEESEVLYRTLFEGANEGILAVDEKTKKFIFANQNMCKLLGYSLEKVLKLGIKNIHPKKDLPMVMETFEKQLSGEIPLAVNIPILRKNKKIIYCNINAQKLKINNKTLMVGFFRDMTQYREAEIKLAKSELKFRTLYQSSKDAIMTLSPPNWRFTAGNQATIDMFRAKSEKDFTSHGPWQLSPKYQPDGQLSTTKAKKMINKAMKKGSNFFEWTHERINGELFPATVLLSKIQDENTYLQATVRDITERKKNEQRINYQIEKLKELDELKSKFLTVTSHELKTPITPIKLQTQMLMEGHFGELSKDQKASTKIIYRNINRLQRLIEDILEIARMQSSKYKYHFTKNDLNLLVKDVIENSKATANKKGLFIKYTTQTKLSKVRLDKTRITQVVTNLFDNAIKFTEKGGINVTLKKIKNNLILTVKDTGIGIPEEHQDKVFEEFYQVEPIYTRKHGGTGLGLSIAKKIINAHNGEIWLKSKFGEGSTFSFSIPIRNGGENEKNTDSG